jgi:hypothetical protein
MASIVAPQDTQRPFAGTGEFFAPQEGQVMEFEDLVAAAMGFDPSAMLGNPTRRGKADDEGGGEGRNHQTGNRRPPRLS